jgi:CubicO group peptidase (beta-lactamase class C family)
MNVDSSAIDALFAQWDTPNTPGCVLAVIHEGAIVYQRAYGMADLEREVPLTTESLFDLGSIGKQFVAALIALLAEEGRLSLDDTVQRYVSELPDYGAPITLRHLLHHTSGVRDYLDIMQLSNRPFENHYPAEELLYLLTSQQNLNFAPGERYEYSNGGYFLLGVVAERVMQQPLTALLRQYILEPLGMQRTQGNDNLRRIAKQRALAYVPAAEHGYATELSYLGGFGDGPLLSCVGDLLLWDQNFYDNRLGKADPRLIEQLETVGRLNNGEPIQYAWA